MRVAVSGHRTSTPVGGELQVSKTEIRAYFFGSAGGLDYHRPQRGNGFRKPFRAGVGPKRH